MIPKFINTCKDSYKGHRISVNTESLLQTVSQKKQHCRIKSFTPSTDLTSLSESVPKRRGADYYRNFLLL